MSLVVFYKFLLVYLIRAEARVGTGAESKVELQKKDREIGAEEPLLSVEAFGIMASLLSIDLISEAF